MFTIFYKKVILNNFYIINRITIYNIKYNINMNYIEYTQLNNSSKDIIKSSLINALKIKNRCK